MLTLPEMFRSLKKPLTVLELSERLNVSKGKVYVLVKDGRIPYFCIGESIRFDPAEIATWIEGKAVPAIPRYRHRERP
jgi:excisionase family DNA binding protein